MRQRITRISRVIVASTNPILNEKICSINGRRNTLDVPIMVGERSGLKARAVLNCTMVNIQKSYSIPTGTFDSITNKRRIGDRMISKMCSKIN